jgi:hypothetical protein
MNLWQPNQSNKRTKVSGPVTEVSQIEAQLGISQALHRKISGLITGIQVILRLITA